MKALAWALPWLLVLVAAAIWAVASPPQPIDSARALWNAFTHFAAPMFLAGILVHFGAAIGEGMKEALREPPRK